MRVQRICRRLVLLLLAAACLCQMALAVNSNFRYGSKNVSWVEMDGDDFLLLDGDEADRDHPTAYAGDWMKVNLPMRTSIGEGVLQELRVEACEPESLSEARRWPFTTSDFSASCKMFASSYDWYVAAIWDDEELDMTFQIPVPSGALAGTYNLYFKVTADYYDANNNRHDREVLITAEVEVLEGTGSGSASSGSAGTAFAGVKPNDNDKVVSSNVHALLIADAGVSAPTAKPGENAEILMPLVVNREYLPSDLYFLRNITIEPSIPTTIKDIGNWPFDITSISYVRHLDDMTYNSRADVEYSIPVSQTAKKGVYPIDFTIWATVWRYHL